MAIARRIPPGLVETDRLDAAFYRPEYTKNHHVLTTWGTTKRLGDVAIRIACGPFGSDLPSSLYRQQGIPLYRVQNVLDGSLSNSGLVFLDRQSSDRLEGCQFGAGDLLLAKSGILGRVANVPSDVTICNVTQDVVGVAVERAKADSHYLCSFFSSAIGRPQIERWGQGNVQQHLNMPSVRRFMWLDIAAEAQCYIGDKIRQAERLRERARRLEAQFRSAVGVPIPAASSTAGKTSRMAAGELGRNLNPGAHTPDRRTVRAAIRGAGCRSLHTMADVESPTTDSYLATAPYLGLDAIDSATCGLRPSTAGAEAVTGTARLLREGPALSRLRPYLNKVTYIPPTLVGGIGSTELLLIRPNTGIDGWFLYGVLKLESSVRQLNPVATGSTHPRVDREDILDLLVPWRDEHEALGAKLRTAQACYFESAALKATATTLVERLIDGGINEADLVTAQKALASGDRDADREILKALRRGDLPDAKPLIPDVDALYALLDGSEDES